MTVNNSISVINNKNLFSKLPNFKNSMAKHTAIINEIRVKDI